MAAPLSATDLAVRRAILDTFVAGEVPTRIGVMRALGLDREPRQMVYYSIRNSRSWNTNTVVWRSAGDPASHIAAIRDIVRRIDPSVALFDVRTLDDMLASSLAARRFNM